MTRTADNIARALNDTLSSPSVLDSNGEVANVVDTLQFIANGTGLIASALQEQAQATRELAAAVRSLAPRQQGQPETVSNGCHCPTERPEFSDR
jgi:hypothetical protein